MITNIDTLLLVSDLSRRGLQVAETIYRLVPDFMKTPETWLILNRISSPEISNQGTTASKVALLGWLPEDEIIRNHDI